MKDDLEHRVAAHEVGHACIGRLLRLRCGEASIDPAKAVVHVPYEAGWKAVVVHFSGMAGELVVFHSYDRQACETDIARAHERLELHGFTDGGEALWDRTLALLRPRRSLIVRLATELRRAGVLDGATIDAIVARWRS